jgi:hypothetical protein
MELVSVRKHFYQDILLRVLWMEVNIHYVAHVCKSVVFLKGFESHDQCDG